MLLPMSDIYGEVSDLWDKEQRKFQYAALDLAASFRILSNSKDA